MGRRTHPLSGCGGLLLALGSDGTGQPGGAAMLLPRESMYLMLAALDCARETFGLWVACLDAEERADATERVDADDLIVDAGDSLLYVYVDETVEKGLLCSPILCSGELGTGGGRGILQSRGD